MVENGQRKQQQPDLGTRRIVIGFTALVYLALLPVFVNAGYDAAEKAAPVEKGVKYLKAIYPEDHFWQANYAFVVAIGLLVGATELIARYRDKPFEPLSSIPGLAYMVVNGGAAALAYYIMRETNSPVSASYAVFNVLTAGLVAMAFFRSSLFKVRLSGTDISVGPNLALEILLSALDRTYDRDRARPRSDSVKAIMRGISFEQARIALPLLCFNLMQNLSDTEKTALGAQVRAIHESEASVDGKALSLGLALFNLVGEEVLEAAVEALGNTVLSVADLNSELPPQLALLKPNDVEVALPLICNEICNSRRKLATPDSVHALVAGIIVQDVPQVCRNVEILYVLVGHYGETTVRAALKLLSMGRPQTTATTEVDNASPPVFDLSPPYSPPRREDG